jgi:hypothetical protein
VNNSARVLRIPAQSSPMDTWYQCGNGVITWNLASERNTCSKRQHQLRGITVRSPDARVSLNQNQNRSRNHRISSQEEAAILPLAGQEAVVANLEAVAAGAPPLTEPAELHQSHSVTDLPGPCCKESSSDSLAKVDVCKASARVTRTSECRESRRPS